MGMSVSYDEYGRRACAYDPFVERLGTINTRLNGYFQSWKYFRQNEHDLRAHLHFRDDIAWCREHVRGESVVYSEGNSPVTDLAILSSCDHVIMSTGSFSWWAAWLAGGMAVYYDDWPRPMSQLEYFVTKSDYFYPTWAPISMKDRHWKRRVKLTPMYTRSDTFSAPVKTTSNKSLL
ncbi:hypothetical protein NP493_3948g00016 [Ridgeia piscesae]|uniref:L-Fucosyltransferase n=1 Tax=Ridgeia piscesae TaxID=27915 RepID=A0AAD9MVA0_RIDPI|nr:hypothetical protein NP493_3948g00016 [Ridgeia piscesae]